MKIHIELINTELIYFPLVCYYIHRSINSDEQQQKRIREDECMERDKMAARANKLKRTEQRKSALRFSHIRASTSMPTYSSAEAQCDYIFCCFFSRRFDGKSLITTRFIMHIICSWKRAWILTTNNHFTSATASTSSEYYQQKHFTRKQQR